MKQVVVEPSGRTKPPSSHKKGVSGGLDMLKESSMRLMFLFAKRFIAGESMNEALPVLKKKKEEGFFTTADVLGESVTLVEQAKEASAEYVELLNALQNETLDLNVSLKPTQMGLDISNQLCLSNIRKVTDCAAGMGAFVRIDMEGSETTDRTLDIVEQLHDGYQKVGTVIQSMMIRSPQDVERLLKKGISIRLCKGAYKEQANVAFKDKKDVDRQYMELTSRLLSSGIYHGIATHDEKMIEHAKNYATHHGISKDAFEFQMLFGIQSALQKRLIAEGWRLRVYVPFGPHWLKYTYRRLRERKENLWFVAKNLISG